jgi:hypothetical protein
MNKVGKKIFGALILVLITIGFYLMTFQISEKRLVIKQTNAVISIGDLNSKEMISYYNLYEKLGESEFDQEEIKKYTKYIKGLDVIYYNEFPDKNQEDNEVVAVNLGWLYPLAKLKQGEYFDTLGKNYYQLKKVYQEEINKKLGIDKTIYMSNYKGYYFLSDDIMKLSDYLRLLVKKEENKNLTSRMSGKTLGEVIIDVSGEVKEINALKFDLSHKDESLTVNGYIYGEGEEVSKYFKKLPANKRKISNYMGKGRVYINSEDFTKILEFVRKNINPDIDSLTSLVKMFTGKSLDEYISQIDGELVYDYMNNKLMIPLKETKDIEQLMGIFGTKEGDKYRFSTGEIGKIEDNIFYYNGKMEKGNIEPKKDEFITVSANLGLYDMNFKDLYITLGGLVEKDVIKIRATIKDDELVEMKKRVEAE